VSPPALLIYNPRAGRWALASLVDPMVAVLEERGEAIEVRATEGPGHATELARRAVAAGAPTIYAFGGDGTLRETAAGMLGAAVPLGALPGGTTNVVVRALGLPIRPLAAARALVGAEPRALDVGLCNDEPFLMQLSAGLDAVALARVHLGWKRILGRTAVAAVGLATWLRYRCPQLELTADGHPLQATFFGICNLPLYGGPFRLAPEARPDDGRLDLVLFRGDTRGATLAFALDLVRGRHVARADTSFFQVGEVRLPERPLQAQLDGDPRLLRGALVRLADEPLTVLAPRGRQSPSRNSANDTRT
jgi:diacylglycerol kinase family enzyme